MFPKIKCLNFKSKNNLQFKVFTALSMEKHEDIYNKALDILLLELNIDIREL